MAGAAVERVVLGSPIASSGQRIIAAPFQFVTTGVEALRVTVVNSQTGAHVTVAARILKPDGSIDSNVWSHTPTNDRAATFSDFDLGAGALLTLTVVATSAAPLVGQTYVIVKLIQGVGAAAIVLGTLLAGYVTSTQALGWPGSPIQDSISGGGVIRTIVGTDPAAGGEISEFVPTAARWDILAIWARLFTSAVAGTRVATLTYYQSGDHIAQSSAPAGQGPSSQAQYSWFQGSTAVQVTGSNIWQNALPMNLPLLAGENFLITLNSGDPGDNWEAPRYQVREWLEVA